MLTLITVIVIGVGGPAPGHAKPLGGQRVQIGARVASANGHGVSASARAPGNAHHARVRPGPDRSVRGPGSPCTSSVS